MATSTGLVQQVNLFDGGACVYVGPAPTSAEVLIVRFDAVDSTSTLGFKRAMLGLLVRAQVAGYSVSLNHGDADSVITSVETVPANISPIGLAIHGDFYTVSGADIPNDATLVFDSAALTVTVTPDVVRPQFVFVAQLPSSIPLGRNTVHLQGAGWATDAVPIDVSDGPRTTVRTLFSGDPKSEPYGIDFVANPAIARADGSGFYADPALTDRPGFQGAVRFCLDNILRSTEDVLRQSNMDAHVRFVAVFDATVAVSDSSALASEDPPNIIETRRDKLNDFMGGYFERPDVVYVLTGSTTFTRASAWFTTDDANRPGTAFTYDGVNRTHGLFQSTPGSAAVPTSATGLTAFHEFGHAASDFNDGMVVDLYVDGLGAGFVVNKKARAKSTDPVPANFATYQGTTYASDPNRDSLGYPNTWTSYHPQLIDPTRPNMMDNYWLATNPANPRTCRLDRLTYAWYSDRLRAKIFR